MGYKFIVGNGVAILLIAIGMGFLGGAEDFTSEELVIGDSESLIQEGVISNESQVDFDTTRLLYQPDFQKFEPETIGRESGFTWNGQTNNRNEEYGYLTYDVSNISGDLTVYYETTSIIFRQIDFYGDGDNLLSEDESTVINNGAVYDVTNVDELEVRIVDESATFLGFESDKINSQDFTNSSSIERRTLTVEEGFFSSAAKLIQYSFEAVGEIFGTFKAWFDFIWIMPGLIGWFLKGYIGIFITYFIVHEIWLG